MNRIRPHTIPYSCRRALVALTCLQVGVFSTTSADTVAYWNFNSLAITTASAPGSGGVPTSISANVGSGTISLSPWLGLVASFAGSGTNAQNSDPSGASLSLVVGGTTAPFPGNGSYIDIAADFSGFVDPVITFATRGTGSGFNSGTWSYSIGGGSFVPVAGVNTATTSTSFGTATVDLSTYNDLDGAAEVVLRYTLSGGTSSSGNNRIDNLVISATADGPDLAPPIASAFSPADNETGFDGTGYSRLAITFNEPIVPISGEILLKKVADDSIVETFDLEDFDQIELNGPVLSLILVNPLEDNTSYYVEIPNGAITDEAETPNAFPGISGNSTWNFTTAPPPAAPAVAVNKYLNAANPSGDLIELLVIGNGTAGTTVDMRGMVVKDFTTDATADGGGKYQFSTDELWESVPVGTLVVLENNSTASDTDASDFTVRVGLTNTAYFGNVGGSATLDIANNEMIMIKADGSGASGTSGGIHALSGGQEGSLFRLFPNAKVSAATGTSGVMATNPTASVADFTEGTGAIGGQPLTAADFGTFNTATNRAYILGLRGIDPSAGDGSAIIANATASSPLLGSTVFARGQAGQSAAITITSSSPAITLSNVIVSVPAVFGAPGTVTLSGAGAAGASSSVTGQNITISSAAATATAPLVVTIDGLTVPTPALLTDVGAYTFPVATSGTGGTPTGMSFAPDALVTLPIEALRDVNANGVPLDLGAVVAVEGVVTEANFGSGGVNFSGFLQDSTAGLNIFAATFDPELVRGNRFVVMGAVGQFSGVTDLRPSSVSNVINLGPDTPPVPQVISLATLLADPESYEGSLVTVENLIPVSGTWAPGNTVVLRDSTITSIDVRIQAGAEVTGQPVWSAINVTGVLGQFDSSTPFDTNYQIMPRDNNDFSEGTLSDFDTWLADNELVEGPAGDDDKDGRTNEFEYLFGLNPNSGGSLDPFTAPLDTTSGLFTYTRRLPALAGVTYVHKYSTTLTGGWQTFTPASLSSDSGDPVETVTVGVPAVLLDEPKLFIRVETE